MIYRSLLDAQREPGPCASWKTKVIIHVRLADGREFWRTYTDDAYGHRCKRCRGARKGPNGHKLPSTGHLCYQCGNPYCGFVRQARSCRSGEWQTVRHCWSSSGRLH